MIVEKFKPYSLVQNITGAISVAAGDTATGELTVAKEKGKVVKMALRFKIAAATTQVEIDNFLADFLATITVNNNQVLQNIPSNQFVAQNQDATCEFPISINGGDTIIYTYNNNSSTTIVANLLLFYDWDGMR